MRISKKGWEMKTKKTLLFDHLSWYLENLILLVYPVSRTLETTIPFIFLPPTPKGLEITWFYSDVMTPKLLSLGWEWSVLPLYFAEKSHGSGTSNYWHNFYCPIILFCLTFCMSISFRSCKAEIIVSVGMTMPQVIAPIERIPRQDDMLPLNRMV